MAHVGTRLYTFLFGKQVGQDEQGNRYYVGRSKRRNLTSDARKEHRWVVYQGVVEPTRIPAEWHGWLHHTTDLLPTQRGLPHYDWQQPAKQNPTGTAQAYLPPGHTLKGAHRPVTAADYEPWSPAA